MTRFLCTGDQHIGQGGDRYPGRLDEFETLWDTILQLARDQHVDAILHAGDAFERRKPTPAEMLAFERPLVAHRDLNGPPVIMVHGNHCVAGTDPASTMQVFHEAGLLTLSTRPETLDIFPSGVTIVTLPWTPISRLVATLGGGDRDLTHEDAARMLVDEARRLRSTVPGPCVLLGHWSVTGSSLPSGLPVDDLREVVLDTDELLQIGFDAVVFGHIHRAQNLGADLAFYVGSPMPLNHGEPGEHGVWIIDLDLVRCGGVALSEFRPLESTRFVTVGLPIESWDADLLDGAIVRVKGLLPADADAAAEADLATSTAYDCGARHVTVEITVDRPSRARAAGLDETVTVTDAFETWLTGAGHPDDTAGRLRLLHHQIEETTCAP